MWLSLAEPALELDTWVRSPFFVFLSPALEEFQEETEARAGGWGCELRCKQSGAQGFHGREKWWKGAITWSCNTDLSRNHNTVFPRPKSCDMPRALMSVTSNFCWDETEPRRLHSPDNSTYKSCLIRAQRKELFCPLFLFIYLFYFILF